jgi:hypothetical protein
MESDSSAQSLLSLFSSSKLMTFTKPTSRNFYKTTSPPPTTDAPDDPSPDRPRKRRRRSANLGEWTCAEIRALDSYRNLLRNDQDINAGLKDVLLPNRTEEEVRLQLARIERTKRDKTSGSKLEDLVKIEKEEFDKDEKVRVEEMEEDYKRRRKGLDDILGLEGKKQEEVAVDDWRELTVKIEGRDVKSSLDQVLGLSGESEEHRRKRELDEALGLL